MGPIEAELRAFIARIKGAETEQQLLKRQVLALEQGVRDVWADGRGTTGRYRSVHLFGLMEACDGSALAGSSLRLVGHETGIDYGTYNLPAGTFDFDLVIDERDFVTAFNGYTTGPSSRWAVDGGPEGVPSGTSFAFPVTAIPATGYHCFGGRSVPQCAVPLAGALTLADKYGTTTINYGGWFLGGFGWVTSATPNPAYDLQEDAGSFVAFFNGTSYNWNQTSATWTMTCPTDSGTKFDLVITIKPGFGAGAYAAGDTIHIFEP
jgi:hypothetical protein